MQRRVTMADKVIALTVTPKLIHGVNGMIPYHLVIAFKPASPAP